MWNRIKNINYRHYIAILLILGSLAISVYCYNLALSRTTATAIDLADAVRYYFDVVTHKETPLPARIAGLPTVDLSPILPWSVGEIQRKLEAFGSAFFSQEYFQAYAVLVADVLNLFSLFLLPALLLIYAIGQLFRMWLLRKPKPKKKRYKKDERPPKGQEEYLPVPPETAALSRFTAATRRPYIAFCNWMDENICFVKEHGYYKTILFAVWLLSFNVFTIAGAALAFYFYFASSFDILALLPFVARLLMDLLVMLSAATWYVWLVIGWRLLCKLREYIGYGNLDHMERRNRGLVRELPHAIMIEGPMGTGKTLSNTGIVLTKSIDMRDMALDDLLTIELHYPHFRFAALREDLRYAILTNEIKNATPAARWLQARHRAFLIDPCPEKMWRYDFDRYKIDHNDDLKITDLWSDLEDYCKLFFIYFQQSSLIYANFSIREDFAMHGTGNLPMWNHDLFHRDPRRAPLESAYAHILDMDMLRIGKRFVEEPWRCGVIECGCIDITEVEKERRNQLALKELKRLVDECNQLNDGFEDYLKMIRHPSVIRNHVYIFFITDGNRAMDWSAGGREVCSILTVKEVSAQFVAMPLFTFSCMLYDFFKPRHDAFKKEYESTRDDMCLPVQIYLTVCSFFFNRHERCVNRYGFKQVQIGMQTGKMEGEEKLLIWYRLYKKDCSDRYSTDCHRGLFEVRINRATIGVQDYPTYRTTKATGPELDQTHSYFITDVRKKFGEGEE